MVEKSSYPHGAPSWVDLSSRDIPKTVAFYTSVFGWGTFSPGPPDETGGYTMFTLRDQPVAGLGPHQDPTSEPAWSTYITVDDCDKTVATAKQAGATVAVEPMDVMTAGRMAFLLDPQGAFFGVWQAGDHQGSAIVNEANTWCWSEVRTTDVDAAVRFYGDLFGWTPQPFDAGGADGPDYTLFLLGEDGVGGTMPLLPEMGDAAHWGIAFAVADCDATVAAVRAAGGSVLADPDDTPIGRIGSVADPDGVAFSVIALADQPQ